MGLKVLLHCVPSDVIQEVSKRDVQEIMYASLSVLSCYVTIASGLVTATLHFLDFFDSIYICAIYFFKISQRGGAKCLYFEGQPSSIFTINIDNLTSSRGWGKCSLLPYRNLDVHIQICILYRFYYLTSTQYMFSFAEN